MTAKKKPSFQEQLRGSLRTVIDLEAQERIRRLTTDEPSPGGSQQRPSTKPVTKPQDQSKRQSTNQTADQSNTQSAVQPEREPASQPLSPSEMRSEAPKEHLSVALTNGPSTNQSDYQPVNQTQSPTLSHTQNVSLQSREVIEFPLSQNRSQNLSQGLSLSQSLVRDRLNQSQREVLDFLLKTNPYIVKFREIGDCVGLGEATIRTIMRRLQTLDFLSFKKARDGNLQGIRISFNQHLCEQYLSGLAISHTQNRSINLSQTKQQHGHVNLSRNPSLSPSDSPSPNQTLNQPDSQTASQLNYQSLQIDRKEENLSISEGTGEFKNWSDMFLELNWPTVYGQGFRADQVRQALSNLEELGKKADRKKFTISLDHAEWELEAYGCLFDGKGEKVKNPVAFIYRALAQWGWFRAHAEFKSLEEEMLLEAERELKRLNDLREKAENIKFDIWRKGLSDEALQKILENRRGPEDVWLRNYYREHVREQD